MRLTHIAALTASLMALPGCFYDLDFDGGGDWGESGDRLSTSDSTLAGTAGDVNVNGNARVHEAYDYGDYAYIELRARGDEGVVMQGISIDRFDELQIGDDLTFEGYDYYSGATEPHVSVLGCSGPRDDVWDFDSPADEVNVQVDPGPLAGTMQINVTARYDGYYGEEPQTVRGSVVVAVN